MYMLRPSCISFRGSQHVKSSCGVVYGYLILTICRYCATAKIFPSTIWSSWPCCLFAKITEHFIAKIDPTQYGNLKGVTTSHGLVEILHTLQVNVEKRGTSSTLLLTDFSKTFDCLDHTITVSKLVQLEVDLGLVSWIANFLSDCRLRVKYKRVKSVWCTTTTDISQGTKLGSIIFLSLINIALRGEDTNMTQPTIVMQVLFTSLSLSTT